MISSMPFTVAAGNWEAAGVSGTAGAGTGVAVWVSVDMVLNEAAGR